jgi:hypothetical protein
MTSPRVQRQRKADADRRKVATRGKRVPRPPQRRAPKSRRPRYRNAGALAGLSVMFSTFSFMTGSIFWAVGAATTAAASGYVARQAYKRELAEVKRTGRPIGADEVKDAPPASAPAERSRGPNLVQLLTASDARSASPPPAAKRSGGTDHIARCKANPPGGPTCRCPDGPNRKGKPAKKSASAGKKTKR